MVQKRANDDEHMYYPNDTNTYEQDIDDYTEEEVSSDDECHKQTNSNALLNFDEIERPPITEFSLLRIGISSLVISSEGKIRKLEDPFSSSYGFALPGTPYRTYPVKITNDNIEEYFVHDLVWRAFHGEPPEGWEVRHNFWESKNTQGVYSNCLENLEIYRSTVTYLTPCVRGCLPEWDDPVYRASLGSSVAVSVPHVSSSNCAA